MTSKKKVRRTCIDRVKIWQQLAAVVLVDQDVQVAQGLDGDAASGPSRSRSSS